MSMFPAFSTALLKQLDIDRATPCGLFADGVCQVIDCDPNMGRLFAEFVYHDPSHRALREEFRRKLTRIIDYMRKRSCMCLYMKSDYLHLLSPGQINWLENGYDEWLQNSEAVRMAMQHHKNRRFFRSAKEITMQELITYDVAQEIHAFAYPPYNFIERVGDNAWGYMTRLELDVYWKKVEELKEKKNRGFVVGKQGPGYLPEPLKSHIRDFFCYQYCEDNPQDMYSIFPSTRED